MKSNDTIEQIFEISITLEEDVETELAEFALLTRLGITEEAQQIIDTALCRHLDAAVVVQEVVSFHLHQQDWVAIDTMATFLAPNPAHPSHDDNYDINRLWRALYLF